MPSDRSDALVLTLRYAGGRGQRLEIEPGSEDPRADYTLHEEILTRGEEFLPAGSDPVASVDLENAQLLQDDTATGALRGRLETAFETAVDADTRRELRQALQLLDAVEAGV